MKNLLITGTADHAKNKGKVTYSIDIFGQTEQHPQITLICGLNDLKCSSYIEMIEMCKKYFCDYFKVNDFNIITLQSLRLIHS